MTKTSPLARFRESRPSRPQTPAPGPTAKEVEADWLQWYLQNNPQPEMTTDELRAMAVSKGKKIAPGTIEQHDQYIAEAQNMEFSNVVRLYRKYAIFGIWADGSSNGPQLPNCSIYRLPELINQVQTPRYLKWWRQRDPEGWLKFLEGNPSYASQGGVVAPVPVEAGTV